MPDSIGGNLIESAAIFEVAVAEMIFTQAQILQRLLAMNPPGWVLLNANSQVLEVIGNLQQLEESIVKKVDNGMEVHNTM